jgi:purine-cytosine permease-like protein
VLVICIYGFRFMLLVNRIAVSSATVMFALGAVAFFHSFDAGYPGVFTAPAHDLLHAPYVPALVSAILLAMSNPLSFGAFLGDWTRYIPANASKRRVMAAAFGSQVATLVPFFFGLTTATVVASRAPAFIRNYDYVGGLLAVAPGWYFMPLCVIALIGGLSTGTTSLYGTGLDMSSVFARLSRVSATVLVGCASIAFIFIGRFAANLVQSVSTFAVLIVTCTLPWMVIMTIGIVTRRGYYRPDDLQVFTRGQRGGAYWFNHGWNGRGMAAWLPSAAVGLCFVNVPNQFVGPLGHLAGGVDVSIPITMVMAAALYLAALNLYPEDRALFGPQGPRWVRTSDRGHSAIETARGPATSPTP